jgi:hypothetical protein
VEIDFAQQTSLARDRAPLKIIMPSAEELAAHEAVLDLLDDTSGASVWRKLSLEQVDGGAA